jgi:lipid II:glycine glycyltransferase (peptidoglycan interpeptide bridge formation enzyme)
MLVDPKRNPVRDQLYGAQIEYHNLPVQTRQLQRKLREHTRNAKRYKIAFVEKQVSAKNKEERAEYRKEHLGKTIEEH